MFKLKDSQMFKTFEDERNERKAKAKKAAKNRRNHRNRLRRRERKKEWKANNPKPVKTEEEAPANVTDVLKAVSENRKKVKK